MNTDWLYGLVSLSFWGYVSVTWALIQTTLLAATLYLHRDATHRSVALHPVVRHCFRCWIWLSSGIVTREWVAVHRKHHAFADRAEDPHSPLNEGLPRVLLEGAELYVQASRNTQVCDQFGKGAPNDWVERNVYTRHRYAGIAALVVVELALFGVPAITMIGLQMLAIPVLAAGGINGLGHSVGYRNFEIDNAATNILGWGLFAAGEELHNNHHAFPCSARFSICPWELDPGWMCISLLAAVGLAEIRYVAPRPRILELDEVPDPGAVHAVISNRMHVFREYALHVIAPVLEQELPWALRRQLGRVPRQLLISLPSQLDVVAQGRLHALLESYPTIKAAYECQQELRKLCECTGGTQDAARTMFDSWCLQADSTRIKVLREFAYRLRRFSLGGS